MHGIHRALLMTLGLSPRSGIALEYKLHGKRAYIECPRYHIYRGEMGTWNQFRLSPVLEPIPLKLSAVAKGRSLSSPLSTSEYDSSVSLQ